MLLNISTFQDPKNLPPNLPANLVNLMSSGALGATSNSRGAVGGRNDSASLHLASVKPKAPPPPPIDHETPAQKQAAAKLALRKQLEKTLLQVYFFLFSTSVIFIEMMELRFESFFRQMSLVTENYKVDWRINNFE